MSVETDRGTRSLGEFEFVCGESIENLEVAYEAYGEFDGASPERGSAGDPTESASNAVLVCHALTGSQHVSGRHASAETAGQARAWWNDIVGPGKAVDTTEYYVVCANVPGSCYGTSGPPREGPDGEPYGTDFPPVTVGDWTRAQRRLLDDLGVGRLHAVIGGSVGGMNALDWASRYPDDVRRIAPIAAAARLDPQCLALDAIARRAITTDPNWNGGDYYGDGSDAATRNPSDSADASGGSAERSSADGSTGSDGGAPPENGLALARQLGHVMYLSKESMERKFDRRAAGRDARRDSFPSDRAAAFFPYRDVESYLDYQAEKFVERFDANSYLYLTRAMDDYDLSAGYESDTAALAAYEGEALLMSFTGDWHFTTEQSESLAEAFREADVPAAHHVVDSDHGHDAFLVEPNKVGPPLEDFLAEGVSGRAVTDTADGEGPDFAPVHNSLFSG